jgi:hypothetical protein
MRARRVLEQSIKEQRNPPPNFYVTHEELVAIERYRIDEDQTTFFGFNLVQVYGAYEDR